MHKLSPEIVKVEYLKHQYPDKTEIVISGPEKFIVHPKEKIALIGANGSGKSTLLLHLMGILEPTEGSIGVFGSDPFKEFHKIGRRIGVVIQDIENQLIGPTVFDDIAFSLVNYGFEKVDIDKRVNEIICSLNIVHLKDKIIHYLSGGEKKKVALAGALALRPELLILDEALAELDPQTTELALKAIDEFKEKYNMSTIMATNDIGLVEHFADTVYLLEKGQLIFKGSFKELLESKKEYRLCIH